MAKYIVMTNGRGYNTDYPEMHPNDFDSLTMDVRAAHGRRPISLIQAKQRAAEIVSTEAGVRAFICKIEYIAERQPLPVTIRRIDHEGK